MRNAAEKVHGGRAQRSKLPARALWEGALWLTLGSEICDALVEVRAKTSSQSPRPSRCSGVTQESCSVRFPATRVSLPDLPPACIVPLTAAAQTHVPPPGEPRQRGARGKPPRSGRDRRRETPWWLLSDVSVPARRAAPLPSSSPSPNPRSRQESLQDRPHDSQRGLPTPSAAAFKLPAPT